MSRHRCVLPVALLALGVTACSASASSNSSARAACASLQHFEQSRQFNDDAAMRTHLRRAERQADESGDDDLAGYLGEARAIMDDLADLPRSDVLQPKHVALLARLDGNLSFAQAECAEAGHPTTLS